MYPFATAAAHILLYYSHSVVYFNVIFYEKACYVTSENGFLFLTVFRTEDKQVTNVSQQLALWCLVPKKAAQEGCVCVRS